MMPSQIMHFAPLHILLYLVKLCIYLSMKVRSEINFKWGSFRVCKSTFLCHVHRFIWWAWNFKSMQQSGKCELRNLQGKWDPRAHSSTTTKWYQFKILASNIVRHPDPGPIQARGPASYRPWAQAHAGPRPSPMLALGTSPLEWSNSPAPFLKLPW